MLLSPPAELRVLAVIRADRAACVIGSPVNQHRNLCRIDAEPRLDALRRLRSDRYDAVLLELDLPDSRGLPTFFALADALPETPVVVLAHADDPSTAEVALECGASDFLFTDQLQPDLAAYCLRCAFQRRRLEEAEAELAQIQSGEQRRLARELHDGAVQSLSSIRLRMQMLARQCRHGDGEQATTHAQLADEIRDVMNGVRQLARGLHPSFLELRRLDAAISDEAESIEQQTGVRIELFSQYEGWLTMRAKQNLFRIFQECVQNAIRHGNAHRVNVRIWRRADIFVMEIQDDGGGFDCRSPAQRGLGVTSIHERAELLGGTVRFHSSQDEGTLVSVRVPAVMNLEQVAQGRAQGLRARG